MCELANDKDHWRDLVNVTFEPSGYLSYRVS